MEIIKRAVNFFFGILGYAIIKKKNKIINWDLDSFLLEPATVIDIGIGSGTPNLYRSFPKSELFLIDPLIECEDTMKDILRKRRGTYSICALGSKKHKATINIYEDLSCSSLNTRLNQGETAKTKRAVMVQTLDELVIEKNITPPYLIKIDTEGHELEIIQGATISLSNTIAVIAELSASKRFAEGYRFVDFLEEIKKHKFHLKKILHIKSDDDGGIKRMDVLFCKED